MALKLRNTSYVKYNTFNSKESDDELRRKALMNYIKKFDLKPNVIIECKGGEYRAHSQQLAQKIPYFERKFPITYELSFRVKITHTDKEIVEVLLCYVYNVPYVLPNEYDFLLKLFKAAWKFEMNDAFMVTCISQLLRFQSANNFFEFWELCEKYKTEWMNTKLTEFLKQNVEDVVCSSQMKLMEADKLNSIFPNVMENLPLTKKLWGGVNTWIEHKEGRNVFVELEHKTTTCCVAFNGSEDDDYSIKNIYFIKTNKPRVILRIVPSACTIM